MARSDLTDFEWSVIEPLLPTKVRGGARMDDVADSGRQDEASKRPRTPPPWFRSAAGSVMEDIENVLGANPGAFRGPDDRESGTIDRPLRLRPISVETEVEMSALCM